MTATSFSPPPTQRVTPLGVWLTTAVIALTLVGYPLAGLLSSGLGLESTVTSIPMRVLVLLVSTAAVAHFAVRRHAFRLEALLLLFFWLYSVRLVWDLQVPMFDELLPAIFFFLATAMLPALAAMVGARSLDEALTARVVFIAGSVVCVGALALDRLGIGATAELTTTTGRLSLAALNPISLGHVATTTVIAALSIWGAPRVPGGRLALVAGVALALACLFLAASRGPIVALIMVAISYSVLRGRWGRVFAGGMSLLIIGPVILATQGITIVERFTDISSDVSALERVMIQQNALAQALANPLFGSAYVELQSGQYPHNLILESFMALGVVGLGLFLVICARGGLQAAVRLREGQVFLPLLLIQYFIAGMFSGALWGAGALFVVLAILALQPRVEGGRRVVNGSPLSER